MKLILAVIGGILLIVPAALLPPNATEHIHHLVWAAELAIYVPGALLVLVSGRRKERRRIAAERNQRVYPGYR